MKLSTNIMLFQQVLGLERTLEVFAEAGFEAVEFNADIEEYYTDAHNKAYYKKIKSLCDNLGIEITQAHAPFRFGQDMADEEKAKKHFIEIVRAFEHSSYLGTKMIVVHPLTHLNLNIEENKDKMLEYNVEYYRSLIPYAEEYGMKIAIENIRDSISKTAKGLLEILNELNNEAFTVCCDVGHVNIMGEKPADMIMELGNNIGCTHIHDNDGVSDCHTLPYYGNIDWESVMKAFADISYEGNLNYEAGLFVKNVPVSLRGESAGYMAGIGKYLIERYWSYKNNQN